MATYKVTYTLGDKKWEAYAEEVTNENVAVMVTDIDHPEIPREASVKVELVSE
jgi:hypothetical protein